MLFRPNGLSLLEVLVAIAMLGVIVSGTIGYLKMEMNSRTAMEQRFNFTEITDFLEAYIVRTMHGQACSAVDPTAFDSPPVFTAANLATSLSNSTNLPPISASAGAASAAQERCVTQPLLGGPLDISASTSVYFCITINALNANNEPLNSVLRSNTLFAEVTYTFVNVFTGATAGSTCATAKGPPVNAVYAAMIAYTLYWTQMVNGKLAYEQHSEFFYGPF